jgi:hypothetical protein
MRIAGTLLMLLGVFALIAVALAVFGPSLHTERFAVGAVVTSVGGTVIFGLLALAAGAYLRRRAQMRRGRTGIRES